jgi:hypothetical protein
VVLGILKNFEKFVGFHEITGKDPAVLGKCLI